MQVMPHPLVVNIRHTKKFDMYGGRTCYGYINQGWGNDFKGATREERIANHRRGVLSDAVRIFLIRQQLPGKTIACWCAPLACHCDILAQVANCTEDELKVLIVSEVGPELGRKVIEEYENLKKST